MSEMKRGMATPWGKADWVKELRPGVYWVSTPGHGGLAVAMPLARLLMVRSARRFGEHVGGFFWFEEDSAWAIACVALDLHELLAEKACNCSAAEVHAEAVKRAAELLAEEARPEFGR